MTDTTEKLLPCPFCGATEEQTANIVTAGKYAVMLLSVHEFGDEQAKQDTHPFYVQCVECGKSTSCYQTSEEAIAAWNHRVAEKPKWTKEPPTEPGWYWVAGEGCNPNDISCVWVFQRGGHLCVSDTMLVTSNWLLSWYCESYTAKLGLGKLLWCKANIPALPEKGESHDE